MAGSGSTGRGPGRPPGSKNKPKANNNNNKSSSKNSTELIIPPDNTERIAQMQSRYDRDRRNVDVIWSITLIALSLFLFFTVVMDTTGSFGRTIHNVCMGLFGIMAYVLPFMILIFALLMLTQKLQHAGGRTLIFSALIFISFCILNSCRFIDENSLAYGFGDVADYYLMGVDGDKGGVIGMELGSLLVKFIGKPGLIISALAIIFISFFLVANTPISRFFENWAKKREMRRILDEMEEREIVTANDAAPKDAVPREVYKETPETRPARVSTPAVSEEPKPSLWRSLINGITKTEEPIPIPPQGGETVISSPDPGNKPGSGTTLPRTTIVTSPITSGASVNELDYSKLPEQKDDSVMSLLMRDTLFGRIARKFGAGSSYDDEDGDYGYPGRKQADQGSRKTGLLPETASSSCQAAVSAPDTDAASPHSSARSGSAKSASAHKSYGLGDPDEIIHSGSYGLDGNGSAGTFTNAAGPAVSADIRGLGDVRPDTVHSQNESSASASPGKSSASSRPKKRSDSIEAPIAVPAAAAAIAADTAGESKSRRKPAEIPDDPEADAALAESFNAAAVDAAYEFPPVSLLRKSTGPSQMMSDYQLEQKAALLEKTLNDFGVDAKVLTVTQGASVTRYEVQPATGVKVSSITKLADDIALNLKAKSIRIEAPIPGKAAVGIEVENDKPSPIFIRELIDSKEFEQAESKITFAVGKDISGNNIVADLKSMPHLLIAGATGSGKSVCINTIITSFLYKARPSELKLIMIDPKVVELSNYNGIPHMLIPVVTDPRKAARALAIAVEEMDKRYELFAKEGVKDLESYNELMRANHEYASCKPQVVIIIDELADLMMASPADVENSICRLAQKARAAGMHLIVATQRPSVNVVTGLIKANIPSRIAFSVASQFDSRTILDMAGAEKLLGKGDMLFSPVGSNKPYRVQGPFISDAETEKVIKFVRKEGGTPEYDEEISNAIESNGKPGASEPQDELTEDAIAFIFKSKQASVSMLQRRFRIGYNRAARIIDEIEDKGIIGPSDGSRPRQLLITEEQYYSGGTNAAAAEEISRELSPQEKAELEEKVTGKPHMSMMSGNRTPAEPGPAATETVDIEEDDGTEPEPVPASTDEQAAIDYFNSLPESVQKMILSLDR